MLALAGSKWSLKLSSKHLNSMYQLLLFVCPSLFLKIRVIVARSIPLFFFFALKMRTETYLLQSSRNVLQKLLFANSRIEQNVK